jgi:cytochrome c-type biogenesis protein CcmE
MKQKGKQEKKRTRKIIIISLVTLSIFGYLIYTGVRDTMTYYLTVSEVLARPLKSPEEIVRVGGNVTVDSVKWDQKDLRLFFTMKDENSSLNIDYSGVIPDSFKPGREVIIEGVYRGDGQFVATTIMPKCASKYE